MKSKTVIRTFILILVFITSIGYAQNLVPNHSFEIITSCPTGQNQLYLAAPWQMPPNTGGASSDLYNGCVGSGFGVPVNPAGYQNANSGIGYAGFYTFGANDAREYIQVQLTSALVAGASYYVEMFASPSEFAGIGVNSLGIHFSQGVISGNGTATPLQYVPQITNPISNIISDTAGWTQISGIFTAAGGEDYITIGNFSTDSNTDTALIYPGGWNRGYYWVDDISVTPSTSVDLPGATDHFRIFPNPFRDQLNIINHFTTKAELFVYDTSQRLVIQREITTDNIINTEFLDAGVYIYEIKDVEGGIQKGKILKY